MVKQVAALYIDPRGPYPKMADVDCWDAARDATKYDGNLPVVAHPPCGHWGALRKWYQQDDKHLGPVAVIQVRQLGGILEHPAHSGLFKRYLPAPGEEDSYGFTVAVNQVDWGHVARKPTWLYMVGIKRAALVFPAPRQPTHWVAGTKVPGKRGTVPPGIKICSAPQRRRTPPAFARWLVDLAAGVR